MNKADSLSAITKLFLELPEDEKTTLNFYDFYSTLENEHPELLKWRNLSGRRENEVKAHLLNKGHMSIPT